MSEPLKKPRPVDPDDADERPLTLADESGEQPSASASSAGGTRQLPNSQHGVNANGFSAASQAGAETGTTGGFDTMLGKIVVERGLVTAEEVELCNGLLRESISAESPRTLPDLLIDNNFVTERQLARMRTEFEANKSSQQIPGYRIKRKLGAGAMATVFLAKQLSLDRSVAIKVLPKKFSANAKFIERFYKEGRAAAQLNHPNIVAAYDVGKAGEHHYFVMEYVDGLTVYDRIVKDKRVDVKEAIDIIRQVARALQHAHERGFIHRDIKPKNIMINSEGVVKLADLGLARAVTDKEAAEAEAGRAYGTPYYISPEQIRGEVTIGPPADLYGLGATFYHMVTGRVPYDGKNPSEVMHKHLKTELVPPDHVNPKISSGCAQVIEMMMAKKARDRYQNAVDLLEDLDLVYEGKPPHFAHKTLAIADLPKSITSPPPSQPVVIQKAPKGNGVTGTPLFMVMLVLLIASVLGNLIMLAFMLSQA